MGPTKRSIIDVAMKAGATALTPEPGGSARLEAEFLEEGPCLTQIRGVQALGEPAVDVAQQFACLDLLTVLVEHLAQAQHRAQFE